MNKQTIKTGFVTSNEKDVDEDNKKLPKPVRKTAVSKRESIQLFMPGSIVFVVNHGSTTIYTATVKEVHVYENVFEYTLVDLMNKSDVFGSNSNNVCGSLNEAKSRIMHSVELSMQKAAIEYDKYLQKEEDKYVI